MNTIPQFLSNRKPPRVSYSYTKTIASIVFNQKKVVEKLDFDSGTEDMQCDCSTCKYCYEPAGHVVTGDLSIIRDAMLRALVEKGPSCREQNSINWKINEDICRRAVAVASISRLSPSTLTNCSVTFDPHKERRERAWTISSRDACRERHCCAARPLMTSTWYGCTYGRLKRYAWLGRSIERKSRLRKFCLDECKSLFLTRSPTPGVFRSQ